MWIPSKRTICRKRFNIMSYDVSGNQMCLHDDVMSHDSWRHNGGTFDFHFLPVSFPQENRNIIWRALQRWQLGKAESIRKKNHPNSQQNGSHKISRIWGKINHTKSRVDHKIKASVSHPDIRAPAKLLLLLLPQPWTELCLLALFGKAPCTPRSNNNNRI